MADVFPRSDAELGPFATNLETKAAATPTAYGVVAGDVTALTTELAAWNTDFSAHVAAAAAAQSARATKDTTRTALEDAIRVLVRKMQGSGQVSAAEAADLGLNVRDTTPTAVGAPTVAPVGTVDTSNRLRHIIGFRDPTSAAPRAKPAGVEGCEIWAKVGGPPPTDPSELHYLATDTNTPYSTDYDGASAGQTAHYMLRWVSTRHEAGPWSETVSATITG